MTATTHSAGDGSPDPTAGTETSEASTSEAGASAGLLVGMGSADRCANCGAEMAVDQRYCVECGVRRGRPRFSMTRAGGAEESTALVPHSGSNTRTITTMAAAGIVIALLALGVGVLIGHDGNSGKQPVHVTVSGATGDAGAGSSQSSSGGSATTPKSSSSTNSSTAPTKTKNFFGG